MIDVQFNDDPASTSYLDEQRRIFQSPSSSPIIKGLVDSGVIHSERKGGFAVFTVLATLMFVVVFLFFKHVLFVPKIDTRKNFVPAVTIPIEQPFS